MYTRNNNGMHVAEREGSKGPIFRPQAASVLCLGKSRVHPPLWQSPNASLATELGRSSAHST